MKHLKNLLCGLCLMLGICMFLDTDVQAATLLAKKKTSCDFFDDITREISMKDPGVLYFIFKLELKSSDSDVSDGSQGITLHLKGYDSEESYVMGENPIYSESTKMRIGKDNSAWDWWFRSDTLKPGYYIMEAESLGLSDYDSVNVYYEIWKYSSFATSAKLPRKVNIKTYSSKNIKISEIKPKNSLLGAEISVDKKNIADVWTDGANQILVYGKKKGKCKLTVKLDDGKKYKCNIIVTDPAPFLSDKRISLCMGDKYNIELLAAAKKGIKWKSSNSKIATVGKNGKITAKSIGKCNIVAQYKKKKYTAVVTVNRQNPNFAARIDDYYTRDNYFSVWVENYSNKPVTIYSKDAVACNYDYKSFDRNLKLKKGARSITVKPGKKKRIRFYVKGYTTWYDHTDFWIQYKFLFDGKQYLGRMYSNSSDSDYKKGKSYYYTYWNDAPIG